MINLVVDLVANLRFQLGEVFLDASDEDFKADGVVKCGDIELLLLETSGHYGVRDDNRFGQDHVKGAFGCLTFLRRILKTYYYATEDSMRMLKVLFVHARGKKFLCSHAIKCLRKIFRR